MFHSVVLGTYPESPLIYTFPSPYSFVPCSEKIHLAVTEMASLFPKVQRPEKGAGLGGLKGGAGVGNLLPGWRHGYHPAMTKVPGLNYEALFPPPETSPGACTQFSAAAQCQRLPAAE